MVGGWEVSSGSFITQHPAAFGHYLLLREEKRNQMSVGNEAESIYPLVKMSPKLNIFLEPFCTTVPGNRDYTLRVKKVRILFL